MTSQPTSTMVCVRTIVANQNRLTTGHPAMSAWLLIMYFSNKRFIGIPTTFLFLANHRDHETPKYDNTGKYVSGCMIDQINVLRILPNVS